MSDIKSLIISFKSSLVNTTGYLLLSNIIAQSFGVINTILITKALSQSDFGTYSVFISITLIISALMPLSFEMAIPNISDKKKSSLLHLLLIIIIVMSIIILSLFNYFKYEYFISLTLLVVLLSFSRISELLNIRLQNFKLIIINRYAAPILLFSILITLNFYNVRKLEYFILSFCVATGLTAFIYSILSLYNHLLNPLKLNSITSILVDKKLFPIYVAPAGILNNLTYHAPVIIIEHFFSAAAAGQYALVLRFCFGPLRLLGESIGQVYHGKLAKAVRENDRSIYQVYKKVRLGLLLVGLLVAAIIYIMFPIIIELIFGPEWNLSITVSKILSPLFAFIVLTAPLGVSFYVFQNLKYLFIAQLLYFMVMVVSFGIGIIASNLIVAVFIFSFLSCIRYLFILKRINQDMLFYINKY